MDRKLRDQRHQQDVHICD